MCDLDPDLHYFNYLNQVLTSSNYYTESSFKEHVNKCAGAIESFSMCHLNIRSMSKNSFQNYLDVIQYDITSIGLAETWLNVTDYYLYGSQGYHFIEQHRSSIGGGVALCIKKNLSYIERPNRSIFANDSFKPTKNIYIRKKCYCWCSISLTWKWYQDIYWWTGICSAQIKGENKISYILGDFNINILRYNDYHQPTGAFLSYVKQLIFTTNYSTYQSDCKLSYIDW